MNESSKTKKMWTDFHLSILKGKGIDIGCGPDPLFPEVTPFDKKDGDANEITKYIQQQYDFVFSSHCLEHMFNPRKTILEWWALVRPGGHLFVIVPDEDLYEQGVFPSRFNPDHKATFTIKKNDSWSPVSINVLDLIMSLPEGELVDIELQDFKYDRSLIKHGHSYEDLSLKLKTGLMLYRLMKRTYPKFASVVFNRIKKHYVIDQTMQGDSLAQIQFIVRKKTNEEKILVSA